MASILRIKRSQVAGNPNTLAAGELAYSALPDTGFNGGDRLYIGIGTETDGNAANHVVIGGKYFTDQISLATPNLSAETLVRRDVSGGFSASTITADLVGNASTATKLQAASTLSLTGDASAQLTNFDGSSNISANLVLAAVNASPGTFGGGNAIPVLTVNEKGLVTAVTTASISSSLSISGNSGTDLVTLGTDTLQFTGGTGVTTAVTNNTVTIGIGQAVSPTSNVTFNNVSVSGTLTSDDITSTNISVAGNATITGNLTVLGTTTTVNSTTVEVSDKNITIAKDATTSAQADGAGITVSGAGATITYGSIDDAWSFNKPVISSGFFGDLTGNAQTASTLLNAVDISLTGDATTSILGFDGSTNVSASITLADVLATPGNFGNSVTIPNFTVNSKGLITAASNTAIPLASITNLGLAQFDSSNFTVVGGLASISTIDGGTY